MPDKNTTEKSLSDIMTEYARDNAHYRTPSGHPDPGAAVYSFVSDVRKLEAENARLRSALSAIYPYVNNSKQENENYEQWLAIYHKFYKHEYTTEELELIQEKRGFADFVARCVLEPEFAERHGLELDRLFQTEDG